MAEKFQHFSKLTLDDWHNSALLDSRGTLETVRIDTCTRLLTLILPTMCTLDCTSQKLRLQVHGIEGINGLVIVRLDLPCQTKFHQLAFFQLCRTTSGGVNIPEFSQYLPSGISSRPLSTEAMIAVSIDMNI